MKFQIDIKKLIKLLAKDIYDSPYALLRENLQNAYDAVLMRRDCDGSYHDERIDMTIGTCQVTICDNGIGMTYEMVENNYWKAGSSGKNNEAARKAGVVGTFGIGAMANFGVCDKMEVHTRHISTDETIITSVELENISLTEDCIHPVRVNDANKPFGTTIIATLRPGVVITEQQALEYLSPYVQYLSVPVYLNGNLISQKSYLQDIFSVTQNVKDASDHFNIDGYDFDIDIRALDYNNGQLCARVYNIKQRGVEIRGEIALRQDDVTIYGLRNGFGLAPVPLSSTFRWGGVANLSDLVPTAGRDSLTRESIELISCILRAAEQQIVRMFSKFTICDANRGFLSYVYQNPGFTQELARMVTVKWQPNDRRIRLGNVEKKIDGKDVRYYTGADETIISQFANENNYLLVLSSDTIRRNIQMRYLKKIGLEPVPDNVTAEDIPIDMLSSADLSILLRIEYVLQSDYIINNAKVVFSEISHNQPVLVEEKGGKVMVHLQLKAHSIDYLREVHKNEYRLFDGFVKDYVRQHLYPRLTNYVPSSTRQGADALKRIMLQKKDLFSIEERETGAVDEVIKDYLVGRATIADVHRASRAVVNSQKQEVKTEQIGSVEEVVPSAKIEENREEGKGNTQPEQVANNSETLMPQPPIKRLDYPTDMKLLTASAPYQALNNFQMFLALSDKLFDRYGDFFLEPHTTKVIWSTNKIVYVFTHISNQVSMYYDIDLKEALPDNLTGGRSIMSTTIYTKERIFIPVIPEMYSYFNLANHNGRLEFYVRFDMMAMS